VNGQNKERTNAHKQILLSSLDLTVGETSYKEECPQCREKGSFSVTKTEEGLLYNCFRAKCGIKGFIPTNNLYTIRKKEENNKHNIVLSKLNLCTVPTKVKYFLYKKFNITNKHIIDNRIKWCTNSNRIMTPLYSIDKEYFGFQLRNYNKHTKVKSVVYTTNKKELYCPINIIIKETPIVIVEDTWSAIRMSDFCCSVALLGTYLTKENSKYLLGKDIYIALDNDATYKSLKILQSFGGIFKSYNVIRLSKDIKNMPDKQIIREVLPQIYGKEITSFLSAK